ncbi:uncharacterized protein LOC128390352 [Panonychus citri]|uniref:uncharacterized protein LOC128390352 n=1 Tax=Panonychus citri TaxID=50023 RepID=UPI0023074E33|nr:uncharacterized protein LOC128390352 [Panonychus citri]
MKSALSFVVCVSLIVATSAASILKNETCPTPTIPKGISDWDFSYFAQHWYEIGRTHETTPRTVYNTISIDHLYKGKVSVTFSGDSREIGTQSLRDKLINFVVGNFNGKSYYDLEDEPYSFNVTTPEGKQGIFWMPYYSDSDRSAVLSTCVQNDDKTTEIKAWYVSLAKRTGIPTEVIDLVTELTGRGLINTFHGDFY